MEQSSLQADLEQYLQYHNRLASFVDWPLEWEANQDKPTPETFARAGFFFHPSPPNLPDNVVCPCCKIFLDTWDPNDDPMREHKLRSPMCEFVKTCAGTRCSGEGLDEVENENMVTAHKGSEASEGITLKLASPVSTSTSDEVQSTIMVDGGATKRGEHGGTRGAGGARGTRGTRGSRCTRGTRGGRGTRGLRGSRGTRSARGARGRRGPRATRGSQGARGTSGRGGGSGHTTPTQPDDDYIPLS